jgi:hypothetical protein
MDWEGRHPDDWYQLVMLRRLDHPTVSHLREKYGGVFLQKSSEGLGVGVMRGTVLVLPLGGGI